MKYILVYCSIFLIVLGCQQNKDYEAFIDENVQGIKIFDKDFFLVGERLLWVVCGLTLIRS